MRVLFIVPYVPSVVRIRPMLFLRALAQQGVDVHLVCLRPPEDRWAPEAPIGPLVSGLDVVPISRGRTMWNAVTTLASGLPLQAAYSREPSAEARIRRLVADGRFDAVHVEHLRGAALLDAPTPVPTVFDAVDCISLLFEQARRLAPGRAQRWLAALDLPRTRRFEATAPFRYDRTLVTSAGDRDGFARLAGARAADRIAVVPNPVDTEFFRPALEQAVEPIVVFTGKMSYHANVAAARALALQVMPIVWASVPRARLVIAGREPSAAVLEATRDPRITVTGFVDDLRPIFHAARAAVLPLTYGVGIQNKALEAMACGVPVIATPVVASGLAGTDSPAWLVGGTPAELARHTVRVLGDDALRRQLADAGRAYVERHHTLRAAGEQLRAAYASARSARDEARSA